MRDLSFIVKGQYLEADPECDFSGIVRGTDNYLRMSFVFDREWDGMAKAIQLSNLSGETMVEPLTDAFVVPKQVTGDSIIKVKIYGMKGMGEHISTNDLYVKQS